MVLMSVDLPKPVWPVEAVSVPVRHPMHRHHQRVRNLPTQITLNWNPRFSSLRSICDVMLSKPTWLEGVMVEGVAILTGSACG